MDTPSKSHENLSFARRLFFGEIEEEQVFPFPDVLDDEARGTIGELLDPLDRFMDEHVDSEKIDHDAKIPDETLEQMKEMGLFGIQISPDHGGLGLSNTGYARLFERIAASDPSMAVTVAAHQSIGLKGILLFGTGEQKDRYLPDLATGDKVAAFALTEPTSGSDAGSIRCRAELSEDGEHYILNGQKIWITNGGFADVFTVFAQTRVEVDGEMVDRITAFIVERDFGGVSNGPEEKKLGIKGSSTTTIYFEDTKVPVANVLGGVAGGFKVAMTVLNNGRFGLAAGVCGGMRRMIEQAAAHAVEREQFGKKLQEFGLIQKKFARMAMLHYAAESMSYLTCGLMDRGEGDYALEAAMCKVFASEANWTVVNECLQVMGGLGFMKEYPFERYLRDSRILMIFEGTNEILRLFVALKGIQAPGEHLRELSSAIKDPLQNYGLLLTEFYDRVRDQFVREQLDLAHPRLKRAAVHIEDKAQAFGHAVDQLLRRFGKKIIDEQLLLERIADMAIDLYAMVSVVSRATRALQEQYESAEHEAMLASAFCEEADRRIRRNLRALEMGKKNGDEEIEQIAAAVFAHGGIWNRRPIGV